MSLISKAFSPTDILQGPADLWLGIKAPASANPPVQYTNTLQLDSSGQPPDTSTVGEIATVAVGSTPGTGYAVGDILEITQSGALNGLVRVTTISGSGVTGVSVIRGGTGYSAAANLPTVHRSGGGNDAATVTISTIRAGISLGLTEGPCTLSINPKFQEIRADQHAGPVDAAFVSLACEIDFVVKESAFKNIQKLFAGSISGAFFDLTAGSTNPAADFLQIGSNRNSQAIINTLMLIANRRDSPIKWNYVLAYRAYLKAAISLGMDRKKEVTYKLKFGCLADTSRVAGDQVLQIVTMN